MRRGFWWLLLWLLWFNGAPRETAAQCPGCKVYLVTMSPGDALFTAFGHVALRVVDPTDGSDKVYDYGTYDAEDPAMAYKFLVGTLSYYCQSLGFGEMVDWYQADFGSITVQELALSPSQVSDLAGRLRHDALPENAAYAYHHFTNNCSTRLRDILDDVLGGALSRSMKGRPSGRSIRDLIDASMSRWQFAFSRWLVFGLLNGSIDGEADHWAQAFLPYYLSADLAKLRNPGLPGNPPLVASEQFLKGDGGREPPLPSLWFGILVLLGFGLLALSPWGARRLVSEKAGRWLWAGLAGSLGLMGGLYGSLVVFTWSMSPYPETGSNWTLLVFHPALLALLPAGVQVSRARFSRWIKVFLLVLVACSLLGTAGSTLGWIPQRIWHVGLATLILSGGLWVSLRQLEKGHGR